MGGRKRRREGRERDRIRAIDVARDHSCTRAKIFTILWRAQQSPASGGENPFADVPAAAYYYNAVLWAVENDVAKGVSETAFAPDDNCTRAQIVTLIYRCKK